MRPRALHGLVGLSREREAAELEAHVGENPSWGLLNALLTLSSVRCQSPDVRRALEVLPVGLVGRDGRLLDCFLAGAEEMSGQASGVDELAPWFRSLLFCAEELDPRVGRLELEVEPASLSEETVQEAIRSVHYHAVRKLGDIDTANVAKHFASLPDAEEALKEAGRLAREYLAKRARPTEFALQSAFLNSLDADIRASIEDSTASSLAPEEELTGMHEGSGSGVADDTGPSSCPTSSEWSQELTGTQSELSEATVPTGEQVAAVCQMFRDAQCSREAAVRQEREYIDSLYRTRLAKELAQSPGRHGRDFTTLRTAQANNVVALPKSDVPDSVGSSRVLPGFVVSSRPGIQQPVHLNGVRACNVSGRSTMDIACALLSDTGSGTCLIGEADFKRLQAAGFARKVTRLHTSVEQIAGIGAVNLVLYHTSFCLNFGGVVVRFDDVPVLAGHQGILLGNDFHRTTRTVYDFDQCVDEKGCECEGFIVLRDSMRRPVSEPIFFSHAPTTGLMATTSLVEAAVPIAFNQDALMFERWCEKLVPVRVPAAALGGRPILILPLEDDRLKALPVMVSPGIYQPDKDGYLWLRVLNPSTLPVRLSPLTPMARFIIDPEVKDVDLEFTSEEIIETITLEPGCSELMRADILAMLQTRRRLFASKLGWTQIYKHSCPIGKDEIPPALPPRRLAPAEYAALKEAVDKQMKAGLLEYCSSPFNARPMMVPKFGGGFRCVLDFRKLNELVLKNGAGCAYPLPNLEGNLNSLAKAKWFTAIDLLMGFHQVELVDGLEGKLATAFSTPWGQMCYTRMPMGLTSSPGAFMMTVDAALRGLPPGIAVAYVDDILVPTDGDWDDHMRDVGLVFSALIEAGFTVNPKKVFMGMREVPYLGYIVGAFGTKPNPERTKAIFDMSFEQVRTDASAAARFAGMISFYSRFLKNLHITLAPFHALKAKHADIPKILGSLKFKAAFELLRHQLAEVTAITRPDYTKDFHVVVDTASSVGVGATLMQLEDVEDPQSLRPVAFWSHRLNEQEKGWHVRDQECYGLILALREWRSYVLGSHVMVKTDHKSLKWLMTTQHQQGSRVQGWVADIQQHDLEIDYLPGPENVVADCFSRAVVACLRVVMAGGCEAPSFSSVGGGCETRTNFVPPCNRATKPPYAEYIKRPPCTHPKEDVTEMCVHEPVVCSAWECGLCGLKRDCSCVDRNSGVQPILGIEGEAEPPYSVGRQQYAKSWVTKVGHLTAAGTEAPPWVPTPSYEEQCTLPPCKHPRHGLAGACIHEPCICPAWECLYCGIRRDCDCALADYSKEVEAGMAWVMALHPVPSLRPPSTRPYECPPRVGLVVLTGEKELAVLALRTAEGQSLLSCAYSKSTTLSYRESLMRLISETFTKEACGKLQSLVTAARRFRPRRNMHHLHTYFYACRIHEELCLDTLVGTSAYFVKITEADAGSWECSDDADFCANIVAHGHTKRPHHHWRDTNYRALLEASATSSMGLPMEPDELPRLSTGHTVEADGALFCDSAEDARLLMDRYLLPEAKEKGVIAIDLEGTLSGSRPHVALLQAGTHASVVVFDTHLVPAMLGSQECGLRGLLGDPEVVKVLHSCHGDSYALQIEHHLPMERVFDTGIADSILKGRHPGTSRGLGTVLLDWLGDSVVHLTHKGSLTFVPFMFNARPLPLKFFVYSAEDVEYCVALYELLWAALTKLNYGELTMTLSADRSHPHRRIPVEDPALIFLMVDAEWVVSLRSRESGLESFPGLVEPWDVSLTEATADMKHVKAFLSEEWTRLMGSPPSAGRFSTHVAAHMRKPHRLGQAFLAWCIHPSLLCIFPALCTAFEGGELVTRYKLTLRPRLSAKGRVEESQLSVFQLVRMETSMGYMLPKGGPVPRRRMVSSKTEAVRVLQRSVRRRQRRSDRVAHVNVVVGATQTAARGCLIVHDLTHVFVLSGANPAAPWSCPGSNLSVTASALEAAVDGFDRYAGPAARKGSASYPGADPTNVVTGSKWQLMPKLAAAIQAGIDLGVCAGQFGGTQTFFTCYVAGLADYEAAFVASRNEDNGFRNTATEAKKHPHAGISGLSRAYARLFDQDCLALRVAVRRIHIIRRLQRRARARWAQQATKGAASTGTMQQSEVQAACFRAQGKPASCSSDRIVPTVNGRLPSVAYGDGIDKGEGKGSCCQNASMQCGFEDGYVFCAVQPGAGPCKGCQEAKERTVEVRAEDVWGSNWAGAFGMEHCHSCGRIGMGECSQCRAAVDVGVTKVLALTALHFEANVQLYNDVQTAAKCFKGIPLRIEDLLGYARGDLDKLASKIYPGVAEEVSGSCHSGVQDAHLAEDNGDKDQGSPVEGVPDPCHSGFEVPRNRYLSGEEDALDLPLPPLPKCDPIDPDSAAAPGVPDPHQLPSLSVMAEAQRNHPAIAPYFAFILAGALPEGMDSKDRKAFRAEVALVYIDSEDGCLRRSLRAVGVKGPLILPPQYRVQVFRECHDRQGHLGTSKTWHTLRRLYWWPQARTDLRNYIRLCRICRRSKVPRHKAGAAQVCNNGTSPWSHVTVDVYDVGWESGGFTKVLAFVDQFGKGVLSVPLPTGHTSEDIADAFVHMLMRFYGRPLTVRSDRGSVLISELIQQLYSSHNVVMEAGTAYHHQTVGGVERYFGVLKLMLRTHRLASGDDQWHLYLPLLEMAYNSAVNETTGFSPFFINHLRHPDLALDALTGRPHAGSGPVQPWVADHLERMVLVWGVCAERLGIYALNRKAQQDLKRETKIRYVAGQQVLLVKGRFVDGNLPKVEDPTDGPFTVLKVVGPNLMLGDLRSRRMHETVNEDRVFPYPTRRLNSSEEASERYTVQRIVDRKTFAGKEGGEFVKYRIRWSGWASRHDSWRTMDELQEVAPLVAAYNRVQPFKEGEPVVAPTVFSVANELEATPEVAEGALQRRHFRALDGGFVASPVVGVEPSELYKVGTAVEMLYADDDGEERWYAGVITRSVPALDAKGKVDLSYSVRFPDEPRARSYKLNRNSLRLALPIVEGNVGADPRLHKNAVELRTRIPGIHHEPFAHTTELARALEVVRDGVLGDQRIYAFRKLIVALRALYFTEPASAPAFNALSAVLAQRVWPRRYRTDRGAWEAWGSTEYSFTLWTNRVPHLSASHMRALVCGAQVADLAEVPSTVVSQLPFRNVAIASASSLAGASTARVAPTIVKVRSADSQGYGAFKNAVLPDLVWVAGDWLWAKVADELRLQEPGKRCAPKAKMHSELAARILTSSIVAGQYVYISQRGLNLAHSVNTALNLREVQRHLKGKTYCLGALQRDILELAGIIEHCEMSQGGSEAPGALPSARGMEASHALLLFEGVGGGSKRSEMSRNGLDLLVAAANFTDVPTRHEVPLPFASGGGGSSADKPQAFCPACGALLPVTQADPELTDEACMLGRCKACPDYDGAAVRRLNWWPQSMQASVERAIARIQAAVRGYLTRSKGIFVGMREVQFLGYIVGAFGVRPNPERVIVRIQAAVRGYLARLNEDVRHDAADVIKEYWLRSRMQDSMVWVNIWCKNGKEHRQLFCYYDATLHEVFEYLIERLGLGRRATHVLQDDLHGHRVDLTMKLIEANAGAGLREVWTSVGLHYSLHARPTTLRARIDGCIVRIQAAVRGYLTRRNEDARSMAVATIKEHWLRSRMQDSMVWVNIFRDVDDGVERQLFDYYNATFHDVFDFMIERLGMGRRGTHTLHDEEGRQVDLAMTLVEGNGRGSLREVRSEVGLYYSLRHHARRVVRRQVQQLLQSSGGKTCIRLRGGTGLDEDDPLSHHARLSWRFAGLTTWRQESTVDPDILIDDLLYEFDERVPILCERQHIIERGLSREQQLWAETPERLALVEPSQLRAPLLYGGEESAGVHVDSRTRKQIGVYELVVQRRVQQLLQSFGGRTCIRLRGGTGLDEDEPRATRGSLLRPQVQVREEAAVLVAVSQEALGVERWCEALIQVRASTIVLGGHPILILPLDDGRLEALPILVAAGIYRVDAEGYVLLRVLNPGMRPVRLLPFTPLARFVVESEFPQGRDRDYVVKIQAAFSLLRFVVNSEFDCSYMVKIQAAARGLLVRRRVQVQHGAVSVIIAHWLESRMRGPMVWVSVFSGHRLNNRRHRYLFNYFEAALEDVFEALVEYTGVGCSDTHVLHNDYGFQWDTTMTLVECNAGLDLQEVVLDGGLYYGLHLRRRRAAPVQPTPSGSGVCLRLRGGVLQSGAVCKSWAVRPRPLHSRESPRLRMDTSGPAWGSVTLRALEVGIDVLSDEVSVMLRMAVQHREPMVIKHAAVARDSKALRDGWAHFVEQDRGSYQVNEGSKTDRSDGGSVHSPGLLSLRLIWSEARRMEVGLSDLEGGQVNPVTRWLGNRPGDAPSVRRVERLLAQLRSILLEVRGQQAEMKEPAFVAGMIGPGGGPTHFDDYDNIAVVLVGCKTFYIAPQATFYGACLLGEPNERLGVSPHDGLSSCADQWKQERLEAGDILYLPQGWWHYVDSLPQTVMTNVWARERSRRSPRLARLSA